MTAYEKKRKAAMIAIAYYLEQEKANAPEGNNLVGSCCWSRTGKELAMRKNHVIQSRGRLLRIA
jgi:hypothetical protein